MRTTINDKHTILQYCVTGTLYYRAAFNHTLSIDDNTMSKSIL
jgi:hypothetical protein